MENIVASSTILTLFTTLAQVSFTVAGLMAVAIAGDGDRRDYWFRHEARSLFVYVSFLLLLLPGFVSIGGLIPSTYKVPSWAFVTLFLGLLYSALAITFGVRKRKLAEAAEFRRLEKKYLGTISELGFYGFATLFIAAVGGAGAYKASPAYNLAETGLGALLFLSVLSGAVLSVGLLRNTEELNKISPETHGAKLTEVDSDLLNKERVTGPYVIISLLIAIIAFLMGVFAKSEDR
jgi:hypothetical protein